MILPHRLIAVDGLSWISAGGVAEVTVSSDSFLNHHNGAEPG